MKKISASSLLIWILLAVFSLVPASAQNTGSEMTFVRDGMAITNPNPTPKAFDEGVPQNRQQKLLPFGANLFKGQYVSRKPDELDPNYVVQRGDKIAIRMWGAAAVNELLTVDANGNIFLPDIGEIPMAGVPAAKVSSVVKGRVTEVYSQDSIEVYASLLTSQRDEVRVFVTGNVLRPGQYAGQPDDSLLAYLHQAGGVDPMRGSYRQIFVKRGNRRIGAADLYDFLLNGSLPNLMFRDGDTIVVRPQGSIIRVEGEARNPFAFEFLGKAIRGQDLVKYARPDSSVTNVGLIGTRNGRPSSSYLPYPSFLGSRLFDGDTVRFVSDAPSPTIDISIEGSHIGNSYYAVKKGSRLQEVLDYVAVDPNDADIANIYLKRKSVAVQQHNSLKSALQRLQRSVLTAPASSAAEAGIRSNEASLVMKFVAEASKIRPEGRVVVSDRGKVANIKLEDGDIIVIPQKSDVVVISGEVQIPQALVYARNARLQDYIAQAGGFSERANKERILIRKPNGKVMMGKYLRVEPGDEIMVYPVIDTKDMQFAKDMFQILYQVAVAARAVGL